MFGGLIFFTVLLLSTAQGDRTTTTYKESTPTYHSPSPQPFRDSSSSPYAPSFKNGQYKPDYEGPPQPYAFQYGVADDYTGANFKAQETADGKEVSGSYQVALPDGRIQTVTYKVDGYNGFVADVQYEGTPVYPKYEPKTSYKNSPNHFDGPTYKSETPATFKTTKYSPPPSPTYKPTSA